jgi:hypothetical protein
VSMMHGTAAGGHTHRRRRPSRRQKGEERASPEGREPVS